ncbi:protein-(glutamine-N5) methyltransferase, ribosomal protein L3-specific [Candidatus Riesia sp. GBBU]|nr:protein-(glutamine-N5) methyltransferase, ribosomal protein L3-specific [Candidatus Riesia sp. GBBU]
MSEEFIKNNFEDILELETVLDVFRWTVSKFNQSNIFYGHGTDNSRDEAMNLILSSIFLPLDIPDVLFSSKLTFREKKLILNLVKKRVCKKIPVAYLINKSWFCGHQFYVDRRVIIPKSPIGELIKNRFKDIIDFYPKNILDMCTGSACIAISCSYEFLKSKIDAVDISENALKIARKNILLHGVSNSVRLIHSNLFDKVPEKKYDLIISNPPYVSKNEFRKLPQEYSYEPKVALIAEENGLKIIRKILEISKNFLSNKGVLICEVGTNSEIISNKYPRTVFNWIATKNGGEGIFSISRDKLKNIKK